TSGARTGYSHPYQTAIVISGIFYLCLGSLLLYVTIRRQFGKRIALISTLTIVFATSVFHYGTYDNSYSHIYSFAAIATYLYLLFRLKELGKKDRHKTKWLVAIGLCLGLITLIRVPNAIVALILLPVLFEDKRSVKSVVNNILLVAAPFLVVVMPYMLYLV